MPLVKTPVSEEEILEDLRLSKQLADTFKDFTDFPSRKTFKRLLNDSGSFLLKKLDYKKY